MKALAAYAMSFVFFAPVIAAAEEVDFDLNLWLDGRWVCGSVLPVETGTETTFCEAKHAGKTIRVRGELNALENEQYEVHAKILEVDGSDSRERNKFLVVTAKDDAAEISDVGADGLEKFRFKANVVRSL